jgi:hypothetical protein
MTVALDKSRGEGTMAFVFVGDEDAVGTIAGFGSCATGSSDSEVSAGGFCSFGDCAIRLLFRALGISTEPTSLSTASDPRTTSDGFGEDILDRFRGISMYGCKPRGFKRAVATSRDG